MTDLTNARLGALVAGMRSGALSSVDLVDAHIARLERVNPTLNAVIATRYQAARDEAAAAAAQYQAARDGGRAELPPLLGVPCTIKEFLRVRGMPYTGGGIPSLRDRTSEEDAVVVRRLRDAGAIVLGVTNAPEGGMWMETHNRVFGRTSNPWDPRRTSGGSSGGEAAAVASGAAVFGLGSDIGGSIRIPAAFCGVFGHKPSGGLVPNTGHWPEEDELSGYLCVGPLTRSAEDLWTVLSAIAGPDGTDPGSRPYALEDPETIDPSELVVYPLEGNGRTRIGGEMRLAVRRAASALEAAGARIGHLPEEKLRHGLEMWSAALTRAGGSSYAELLGGERPLRVAPEVLRLVLGRSLHTTPAVVAVALERLTGPLEGLAQRSLEALDALRVELETLLGPRGVVLHPPYPRTAPLHRVALLSPFAAVCTAVFNALQFPATVAPLGLTSSGLPVAVQVAGRRGADGTTLAAAGVLERAYGGWIPAPM